ncbi:class I SAM-dependent methyltransferase [Aeromicrobium sp. S22]|uniref:class I SAM-dependent methyltransferase n=1 Tax=Aeromicrobium sp. S22 TaxID=2662029 RepID=UPI0018929BF3|nr:class I SAM-dependent methyltransferase [Aeromicrobium sp. S22]
MNQTRSLRRRGRRFITYALHEAAQDIDLERYRQAVATSAQFVDEHMPLVTGFRGPSPLDAKIDLLRWALHQAPDEGLVLEFGVATGLTMREIAANRLPAHGFDSFEGLPEAWRGGFAEGAFAQDLPDVGEAELHRGWFEDSLPGFLETHDGPIAFVHMDADLYSSTKTIFDLAFDRFAPGTIILFDEYFNFPGWQQHEHKAFTEFLELYEGGAEYIGFNALHEQVAVRLT